jgi:hypothetical protein
MHAFLAAAVLIAAHTHSEGNPVLGPLRLGQPAAEVGAHLGHGTPGRCWYGASGCTALAYTDGDAVVRVAVRKGEVDRVRIDANAPVAGVAHLPKAAGTIASWRWDGGPVLTAPTALFPGWLPCGTGPIGTEWCGGSWLNRRAIEMQFAMQDGRVSRAEMRRE